MFFLPSLSVSKVIHVVCFMVSLCLQRLYNVHMYGIKREEFTCICGLILLQNINLLYKKNVLLTNFSKDCQRQVAVFAGNGL